MIPPKRFDIFSHTSLGAVLYWVWDRVQVYGIGHTYNIKQKYTVVTI